MSRGLRQRVRVCYSELEEPSFDEYIFCSECGDYVYEYCSIHGPLLIIPDDKVPSPTGFPSFVPRAALTIPRVFLHLAPSNIPGAGIGVFSTLTLPSGVRFGPFSGIKTNSPIPGYSWQIYDGDHKPAHTIDASDANRSNWMRYVNCSRHWTEQNLVAYQYQGQLYYRTVKVIPRCTELLVFYGSELALALGIDLGRYQSSEAYIQLIEFNCQHNNFEANENIAENSIKSDVTPNVPEIIEKTENIEEVRESANPDDLQDTSLHTIENKREVTENNSYICDYCGIAFKEKTKLIAHITSHNISEGAIEIKINVNRTCKFSCLTCDCKFATKSELINHDISIHVTKINYLACKQCDYKTTNSSDLKRHVQTHSGLKPYQCIVCEKLLCTSSSLKEHTRIHSGEKPYECSACDAKFCKSSSLKRHTKIHSGDKPYECSACDAKFRDSSSLKRHTRIHSGDKPYECSACDAKFCDSSSLKKHTKIHSGDKPYECSACDAKFYDSSSLKKHTKIHSGDKPYKCSACDAKFRDSSSLKKHTKIHSGVKPYECSACDAKFRDNFSLKRHNMRIHSRESPCV